MIFKLNTLVFENQNVSSTRGLAQEAGLMFVSVMIPTVTLEQASLQQHSVDTWRIRGILSVGDTV